MARYRVVCTPLAGNPGFVQIRSGNSADMYRAHDGAVLEAPHLFKPFETISRTLADSVARLAETDVMRAHVMEWEK